MCYRPRFAHFKSAAHVVRDKKLVAQSWELNLLSFHLLPTVSFLVSAWSSPRFFFLAVPFSFLLHPSYPLDGRSSASVSKRCGLTRQSSPRLIVSNDVVSDDLVSFFGTLSSSQFWKKNRTSFRASPIEGRSVSDSTWVHYPNFGELQLCYQYDVSCFYRKHKMRKKKKQVSWTMNRYIWKWFWHWEIIIQKQRDDQKMGWPVVSDGNRRNVFILKKNSVDLHFHTAGKWPRVPMRSITYPPHEKGDDLQGPSQKMSTTDTITVLLREITGKEYNEEK